MLTCLYEGVPEPNVEWRLNDKPVTSDQKSVESDVLEEENRYKSVLTLPKEGVTEVSTYACVCRNLFGTSQRTIKLRKKRESLYIEYVHTFDYYSYGYLFYFYGILKVSLSYVNRSP